MEGSSYKYLYSARGADPFMVQHTRKSLEEYLGDNPNIISIDDVSYMRSRKLDNVKAIVFPGGSAVDMALNLQLEGIKKIQEFVFQGGSYIGFCAGGFLAGEFIYESCLPTKVSKKSHDLGLRIVGATLFGPYGGANNNTSLSLEITDSFQQKAYSVFWNGGGYYTEINPFVHQGLAFYDEKDEFNRKEIAVLYSCERKGKIVISNIHPEVQMQENEIEDYFPSIQNPKKLAKSIPQQKALFSQICKFANI